MHSFDLTTTTTVTISETAYSGSVTADDTGAYFGGGFSFDDHWSAGYTVYTDVGGDNGGDYDGNVGGDEVCDDDSAVIVVLTMTVMMAMTHRSPDRC